jgi:hypothetical protein
MKPNGSSRSYIKPRKKEKLHELARDWRIKTKQTNLVGVSICIIYHLQTEKKTTVLNIHNNVNLN